MESENIGTPEPAEESALTPEDAAELTDDELNELARKPLADKVSAPDQAEENEDEEKVPEKQETPKFEKIIEDQKTMIGRQSTEIGTLRSEVAELKKLISQATPKERKPVTEEDAKEFFDDPLGKVQEEIDRRLQEKEASKAEESEQMKGNYQTFVSAIPEGTDIDQLMETMFSVALQDGVPEEAVIDFAKNPWKTNPRSTIALAKRALAEMEIARLRQPAEKKAKKKTVVPFNSLTANVGESSAEAGSPMTREQLADLTNEELDELQKRMKKQNRR